jgi:hypothetical protein
VSVRLGEQGVSTVLGGIAPLAPSVSILGFTPHAVSIPAPALREADLPRTLAVADERCISQMARDKFHQHGKVGRRESPPPGEPSVAKTAVVKPVAAQHLGAGLNPSAPASWYRGGAPSSTSLAGCGGCAGRLAPHAGRHANHQILLLTSTLVALIVRLPRAHRSQGCERCARDTLPLLIIRRPLSHGPCPRCLQDGGHSPPQ